jgi:hypothetical protein
MNIKVLSSSFSLCNATVSYVQLNKNEMFALSVASWCEHIWSAVEYCKVQLCGNAVHNSCLSLMTVVSFICEVLRYKRAENALSAKCQLSLRV